MYFIFFASQYKPITSKSSILSSQYYVTNARFPSIKFKEERTLKMMRLLDASKAHWCDDLSVRMIKL